MKEITAYQSQSGKIFSLKSKAMEDDVASDLSMFVDYLCTVKKVDDANREYLGRIMKAILLTYEDKQDLRWALSTGKLFGMIRRIRKHAFLVYRQARLESQKTNVLIEEDIPF